MKLRVRKRVISKIVVFVSIIILAVNFETSYSITVEPILKQHIEQDSFSVDIEIFNNVRNYDIAQGDDLVFYVTYVTKSDVIKINPELFLVIGPEEMWRIELTEPDPISNLIGNNTQIFSHKFKADFLGLNELGFNTRILKKSDNILQDITVFHGRITLPVKTLSEIQQTETIELTRIGIIISIIFSTIAIGFTGYQTWQLKKERENTLRAWLAQTGDIETSRYFDDKDTIYQKNEYDKLSEAEKQKTVIRTVEWVMILENFGQLPALVQGRKKVVIGKIPTRNEIEGDFSPAFTIMPTQKHQFVFRITPQEHNSLIGDDQSSCIIFDFLYRSEGSKKVRRYGFIGAFSSGKYLIKDTWTEKIFNF